MAVDKITARTGNAPVKKLGQTRGSRFGTNRDAKASSAEVREEKSGS